MSVKVLGHFSVMLFIIVFIATFGPLDAQRYPRDAYKSTPQLILAAGYPVEKHRVVTEDGYILQMHRIPAGRRTARRTPGGKGKKAVLICHGLLGSSGDFVIMGPDRSLSYILADAGYDVWLANLRGNIYSSHLNLSTSNPDFWEFSFHEHGKYDLTASIDKILNVTGLKEIMYVGYSMGTTSFFTMMSETPEYNEKITAFVALAPAVYLNNVKGISELFLKNLNITNTLRAQGMYYIKLPRTILETLVSDICGVRLRSNICLDFMYSIVGEDYDLNDWDKTPLVLLRFQPASWRQLEHFAKIGMTGVFTAWNGGLLTPVKPYNLSNVRVPVTLLYGENDLLTPKMQVMRLAKELSKNGMLEEARAGCSWPKFNHLDFVFAKNLGKLLNNPLVSLIDNLHNKYYKL